MIRLHLALPLALCLLAPIAARADYHIFSPYEIDLGELEIEHNGTASFDHRKDFSGAQSHTLELGTGLTSWWHSEIEVAYNRDAGSNQPGLINALVWENMFQLTEPGEKFFDWGFYAEYGQSLTTKHNAGPNEFTAGPVIGKDIGRTTNILNLFLTRQVGPDQTTNGLDFSYAWQTRWNIWQPLSPAIEIYGDAGILGKSPQLNQQLLLVGPVAIGSIRLNQLGFGNAGKLKYELGWLFGATQASPQGTLRWRMEVEIPF